MGLLLIERVSLLGYRRGKVEFRVGYVIFEKLFRCFSGEVK